MTQLNIHPAYGEVEVSINHTDDRSYSILIGHDFGHGLTNDILETIPASSYAVVCDTKTAELQGKELSRQLEEAGALAPIFIIERGEQSKSIAVFGQIIMQFQQAGMDRDACVLAVGGGVVGDLAGFAAGCFMRGIRYVQIPTTLLAQVDSSVGGKVAVNIPNGKNYCGLFRQPQRVYIDVRHLATLSKEHYFEGMAEVVKYACITTDSFHGFLLDNKTAICERDPEIMAEVVRRCCAIKAEVVEKDEKDVGCRMILNYGHTFGHAIESCTNYAVSHGMAVAYGMRAAAQAAFDMGILPEDEFVLHQSLLEAFSLASSPLTFDVAKAVVMLQADKKSTGGKNRFILPRSVGRVYIESEVPDNMVEAALRSLTTDRLQPYTARASCP